MTGPVRTVPHPPEKNWALCCIFPCQISVFGESLLPAHPTIDKSAIVLYNHI